MTYDKILEKLCKTEEILLFELLDLNSEDIIDAFLDRIKERYEYIEKQFEGYEEN